MRLDELADLQPVTDPVVRQAYLEIANRLFEQARNLVARHRRAEAKVVQRDAVYFWLVASGRTPREAEAKAAAEVRSGWSKEVPTDPAELPPVVGKLPELDGRPDDPLELIRELWTDPDLVEITSRFTRKEWEVAVLIDGMHLKAWEAADLLKCSVKAVQRSYARARSKYSAALRDYEERNVAG